jgi:hypothetical protein
VRDERIDTKKNLGAGLNSVWVWFSGRDYLACVLCCIFQPKMRKRVRDEIRKHRKQNTYQELVRTD